MKKRIFELLVLIIILSLSAVPATNSFFTDHATVAGLNISLGCWVAPSVPVLNYPPNGTRAGLGSAWNLNPYMDWQDSGSSCPLPTTIEYQYESYHDAGLTQMAYQSIWLSNSQIAAPSTPEGTYYWHVRSRDNHGNTSEFSAPWLLIVDRTAPTIPLLYSPGNNTQFNSSALDQTWQQVSDDSGGEVFYDYESYSSYDGTNLSNLRWTGTFSNSANSEGGRIVKHAEDAPNGDVYWRVRARDEAGNSSGWSQVWHFLISNTTPDPVFEPPLSPALGLVVLNEILPDPLGDEFADRPNGEWVELYNKSGSVISVAGWYISDSSDTHKILIEGTRTNTGGTDIAGHSYLVVYMNSAVLNNTGDTVNLYAGSVLPGNLIDSHTFGSTPEGKSIARFPDGSDFWFDPIPTPGGPNKLEEGPTVDFSLRDDKRAVSFQASNIKKFKTISYEITYDAQPEAKQIAGTADLGSEDSFVRENLLLGTCSTVEGKVCVYDWGMTKITLKIVLTLPNGQTTEIIKEIAY